MVGLQIQAATSDNVFGTTKRSPLRFPRIVFFNDCGYCAFEFACGTANSLVNIASTVLNHHRLAPYQSCFKGALNVIGCSLAAAVLIGNMSNDPRYVVSKLGKCIFHNSTQVVSHLVLAVCVMVCIQ